MEITTQSTETALYDSVGSSHAVESVTTVSHPAPLVLVHRVESLDLCAIAILAYSIVRITLQLRSK